MIEQVGDTIVQNYTSNVNVKEYIQEVLIPKAFPDIPMNKLNLGFTGVTAEYISQAIEDSYATATLMMNEAFITRAVLPESIYSEASLFNIGYTFAIPSKCNFAVQLWLPDIIKYATAVKNSNTKRYVLDKNTKIILGNNAYKFDYDVIIDYQFIDGNKVFNIYYDMNETNSISSIKNKYINHQVTSIDWLVLFVELQEFDRKTDTAGITDNLVTTNSSITLRWTRQIAGIDLVYITPNGDRLPMKLCNQYTKPIIDPFVWYKFINDQTIELLFSSNKGFFTPSFNSKVEYTIYTCNGKASNFDSYDRRTGLPVQKTGDRYSYNANTKMVALCYGGPVGGANKGDIEDLRNKVILAHNTANVLTTDRDLDLWFNTYAKRYDSRAKFFKRRDDPTGTLFSGFISINDNTYVYPTNTLDIEVNQDQFDYINSDVNGVNQEFIIKPGHVWEYADKEIEDEEGNNRVVIERNKLRMIDGLNGPAMITDESLPGNASSKPFLFINPFYIKIYRDPTVSMNYNTLINHTSWPENIPFNSDSFYQFQLASFSIERNMTKKYANMYKIQVICVPVVTSNLEIDYVAGVGDEYPKENNNLRMVMITKSALDGETGYMEMTPVEIRKKGASYVFEADLYVYDNINSDMMIEVDMEKTEGIHSLIGHGLRKGKVFIDSAETNFNFCCMMKDYTSKSNSILYGDEKYIGYTMTNRFSNAFRDLTLYKPMSMMRSVITFDGENENYTVKASLIPFLKYDVALDEDRMSYFVRAYGEQYTAMEPVLDQLGGNSFLDFKLMNTYGRSSNYYIGPQDGIENLHDSNILLDNVYVKIKLRLSVYDRSLYNQTVKNVINEIKLFFDSLNNGDRSDVHVSDLIYIIIQNIPNVRYVRFIGFNDYDANKQSIFVKFSDISELSEDQLQTRVPELISIDADSIEIIEEV